MENVGKNTFLVESCKHSKYGVHVGLAVDCSSHFHSPSLTSTRIHSPSLTSTRIQTAFWSLSDKTSLLVNLQSFTLTVRLSYFKEKCLTQVWITNSNEKPSTPLILLYM